MTNLEKMQSVLNDSLDALLLTSKVSRLYAARYDVDEGVAVIGRNQSYYFTDSRYIEMAEANLHGFTVREVAGQNSYTKLINEALADLGAKNLGVEEEYLTHAEYLSYEKVLNAALIPCQKEIFKFRTVKEDWEVEHMLKAQEITDRTFTELLDVIKPGMTERELNAELIYRLYKHGADGLSFIPIVVSGPNTSIPHGVPGERKIQEGDFVTMDFGCIVNGYCSDMTRTVAVGFVSEEMAKVYDTVLQAQLAGIAATKAGVTGQQIDGAARKVIEDAGYGEYFTHSYGHSLGIEIHEAPFCNKRNDQPMPAGAVSSAEPGIYIPGKFGVRIEDVVVINENDCTVITKSPKNLIII